MNYVQGVSGVGGWFLNIFVIFEMELVFGGIYFLGFGFLQFLSGDNDEVVMDFQIVLKKVCDVWLDQEVWCWKEVLESLVQLWDFVVEGIFGMCSIIGV